MVSTPQQPIIVCVFFLVSVTSTHFYQCLFLYTTSSQHKYGFPFKTVYYNHHNRRNPPSVHAFRVRPSRAPNAVHVVVTTLRSTQLNHRRDARIVQTPEGWTKDERMASIHLPIHPSIYIVHLYIYSILHYNTVWFCITWIPFHYIRISYEYYTYIYIYTIHIHIYI
jgi:hypothetical protein